MGKSEARLLVRLQVGHRSELLEPGHPAGHTHRWTVYVRNQDGTDFQDRSFVEKVLFVLHVDFPNYKRTVKEPPYQVTETGYAGFTIPLSIWLAGKQYKVQYDLNLTMEQTAVYNTTTTISIGEYTPQFYSIAKRFGAEKLKRSREQLGIPGLDGGGGSIPSMSPAPPPEKIRKKDRSSDVSARSSPAPPIERLKLKMEERERDLRKAESSISPPIRAEKAKREQTATPPLYSPLVAPPIGGGGGGGGGEERKEKKKKENSKLLGFVRDRPSPSPSPAVVDKLKREERKKDPSASPSTSSAVERLKKEEKKRDKDHPGGASPSTTSSEKMKLLERKLKEGAMDRKKEKEKEKERDRDKEKFALSLSSLEKKEKERKEKDLLDRLPTLSQSERKEKERKEKRKEDDSRPSSAAAGTLSGVERQQKKEREREREREKEKEREKDLPSLTPPEPSSAYKREKEKEKERKKKDKDRDRPRDAPSSLLPSSSSHLPSSSSTMPSSTSTSVSPKIPSLLSISVKRDKEAEKRNPPSITPPPVLTRQECAPSSAAGTSRNRGSASPPTLMPMANGRSSDYAASSRSSASYGVGSGTVASQSTSSASALPSLQQPSPCSSIGGRETPSEKASGRSSISPGLRNEETASSGGSSASSHSSDRREQKRIPKLAPSQREREAMSAPLASIDAASVRRRIDALTDDDKIFEIALLLIDLDDNSHVEQTTSGTSLTYDLSRLDQKDLLRLDSLLSGS